MSKLTHFNEDGNAHMVDVSAKNDSSRTAVASGRIRMQPETVEVIRSGTARKGDVLGVAQVAGIMAAKNTPQIIPMCHPLMLTGVDIHFNVADDAVEVSANVKTVGKTGVEMEALSACSASLLTIYDMVKAIDRGMVIEHIQVESKEGGASGNWKREPEAEESADLSCVDGVCAIGPAGEPGAVDLTALGSIRLAQFPTQDDEHNPEI